VVASQSVATTSFSYDTLNRLTNISHRNPADALLNSYVFAYDSASRITRIDDMDGVTNYVYDQRDQLTSANHADALNPDENYSYDATGNRTTSHRHGTGYVVGDGVAGTIDNNRQTSDGTYTYAYDAEGNLTTRTLIASGAVREFTWDHRNRLTRVTDRPSATGAPTQVVEYSYDAMNRRIASKVDKTPGDAVDGTITYFVYDGIDVFADLTDPDGSGPEPSAVSMRYLHGPSVDQVLAQESTNGDVQWMLTDHLGTVRDLVNNGGAVVNHIKYDSYGNVVAESGPAVNTRFKYTGREFDSETEMQYNRARYYDAAIGRLISEDPIGFEGGDANIYRYVANSPILATDPFGMESWDAWIYNNLGLGSPNPRPTQQPGLSEKMISTLNSIGSGIKGFILWFLGIEVRIASEVCEVAKDVAEEVGDLYGSANNFESADPNAPADKKGVDYVIQQSRKRNRKR
jgi:RHS repeat-associated protein